MKTMLYLMLTYFNDIRQSPHDRREWQFKADSDISATKLVFNNNFLSQAYIYLTLQVLLVINLSTGIHQDHHKHYNPNGS